MKTLLIFASPHAKGDTAALTDALIQNLNGEVVRFECYRRNVSPCVDCRRCLRESGCAIQDDMRLIYDCLADADAIVLASPVYYSLPTPPAIAVMSRLQTVYAARFRGDTPVRRGKPGGVLLTGGGSGGMDSAETAEKRMLRAMGVNRFGETAISAETDRVPACEDANAIAAAARLAEFLNGETSGKSMQVLPGDTLHSRAKRL